MNLEREILKTLAFYSVFDFPLTAFEIYKNLGAPAKLDEVCVAIDTLKSNSLVKDKNGYYFLPQKDSANPAEKRKARFLVSFKKLNRAKKIAWFLSYFPFVRFIGICNSLGYFNASDESDIDFFIIARRGRVWTARFFMAFFLKIFNLRPTLSFNRDRICLSFIIADDGLDISAVKLDGGDPYFYHWFSWIMPLYGWKHYKNFIEANSWIKNYFPNFLGQGGIIVKKFSPFKMVIEKIFLAPQWEAALKAVQLRIMPKELKEAAASRTDKSVVINDKMLKFHLADKRKYYRDEFERISGSLNLKI